jgi:hypothetical protein
VMAKSHHLPRVVDAVSSATGTPQAAASRNRVVTCARGSVISGGMLYHLLPFLGSAGRLLLAARL